jgi:hypothetical protein
MALDLLPLEGMLQTLSKEAALGGVAINALQGLRGALTAPGTRAALGNAAKGVGKHLVRSAGNIGAGMGVGAAGGGLIGAAHGAVRGYKGDPEQEGSGGLIGGLTGALSGGSKGALIGGAAGGLAGLASGGRGSETVAQLTSGKYNPLGLAARSGQRQLHSVTGLVPNGAARGTKEYVQALHGLNVGGLKDKSNAYFSALAPKQTLAGRILGRPAPQANFEAAQKAHDAFRGAVNSVQSGQTSLAGLAQNYAQKGFREGSKDVLQAAGSGIKNRGLLGGAALVAGTALPIAASAMQQQDPEDPNQPSKGQRIGGIAGQGLASVLTPMIGSTAGGAIGAGGRVVGSTIGEGINKVVGALRPPTRSGLGLGAVTPGAQPDLSAPPVQREYTNAALGKPPEGLQT